MDKGTALNERVWKLFEDAGFRTFPNSHGASEFEVDLPAKKKIPVDLHASDSGLGITIIASNKSGSVDRWTEHVHSCVALGRAAKADKVLFIVTGQAIEEDQKAFAEALGALVWSEQELSYFRAVVDAIGTYARFEIIHALGLKTSEEKDTHKVLAIRLKQPTTSSTSDLFMFTLSPERLLKLCVVYRRAQGDAAAYQRMLRKNRLPNVQRFVSKTDSLLPTDLIVYFNDKITVDVIQHGEFKDSEGRPISLSKSERSELVVLNIPMEYASLELIDGQHRLYGFVKTDAATRTEFNLVVLGMKDLTQKQRRDTFVSINDNSRRMDPNLVAYLKYTTDDAECQKSSEIMAIRIAVDLNKISPFRKAIRLLDMPSTQRITLKGFAGYDLRGLVGTNGWLRRRYPSNNSQEFLGVLRIYFSTVKSVFPKQWKSPEKYIIATNRGISALLKLLRSILKTHDGPISHELVKKYLIPLKSKRKLWESAKLQKNYVGSQGWKTFHRDLIKLIRVKYPELIE